MDLSPKALRDEFARLTSDIEAIRAKAAPLRDQRDQLLADTRDKELKLIAKIGKLEEPLYDMEQARAALVRALSGKTGEPFEQDEPASDKAPAE